MRPASCLRQAKHWMTPQHRSEFGSWRRLEFGLLHRLLRSSTTSLTTPTSSPCAVLTFVPMILLVCTYPLLVELVVVWVCAIRGAAAKPSMASAAPYKRDVFIMFKD